MEFTNRGTTTKSEQICHRCLEKNLSYVPVIDDAILLVNFDGVIESFSILNDKVWQKLSLRCKYSSKAACRVLKNEEVFGEIINNYQNNELTLTELWNAANKLMTEKERNKRRKERQKVETTVQHYNWQNRPLSPRANQKKQYQILEEQNNRDEDFSVQECCSSTFMKKYLEMCREIFTTVEDGGEELQYFDLDAIKTTSTSMKIKTAQAKINVAKADITKLEKEIKNLQTDGRKKELQPIRALILQKYNLVMPNNPIPIPECLDIVAQYLAQSNEALDVFTAIHSTTSEKEEEKEEAAIRTIIQDIIKTLQADNNNVTMLPAIESAVSQSLKKRKRFCG